MNKIWSNESLFLLKTLKIPYIKQTSNWYDDSEDDDESEASCQTENHNVVEDGSESTKSDNEPGRNDTVENRAEPFDNPDDFFSKIDSRIHKCKEDWTKIRSVVDLIFSHLIAFSLLFSSFILRFVAHSIL